MLPVTGVVLRYRLAQPNNTRAVPWLVLMTTLLKSGPGRKTESADVVKRIDKMSSSTNHNKGVCMPLLFFKFTKWKPKCLVNYYLL